VVETILNTVRMLDEKNARKAFHHRVDL